MSGWLEQAFEGPLTVGPDWEIEAGADSGRGRMPVRDCSRTEERIDRIGWGLLFLLVAALALPSGPAEYASVALVGALMLVLNAYRMVATLDVSWFGVVLGGSCAISGGAALAGARPDLFAVFFAVAALVTIGLALRPSGARGPGPRVSTMPPEASPRS